MRLGLQTSRFQFYREADALLKSLCAEAKELELSALRALLRDLATQTLAIGKISKQKHKTKSMQKI